MAWKDELQRTYRQAKPAQKIALFVIVSLIVIVFLVLINAVFSGPNKPETDERESFVKSIVAPDTVNGAVINDATTQQGQMAAKEAKYIAEKKEEAGQSVFQPLVANAVPPEPEIKMPYVAQVRAEDANTQQASRIDPNLIAELNNTKSEPKEASANTKNLETSPYAGLSPEQYAQAMAVKTKDLRDQIVAAQITMKAERQHVAMAPIIYASAPVQTISPTGGDSAVGNTGGNTAQNTNVDVPMLFAPGDKIFAFTDFTVDSRIPNPIIMRVMNNQMKDARIRCSFADQGSFLVPKCDTLTFQNKVIKIDAIVLNPNTLNGIVEQDVDDDLLMKTLARFGSGVLNVAGTQKLASGNKKTDTSDGTTTTSVTENTLTDREILLGATATTLGQLTSVAEKYYAEPSVKTIPAQTQMIIVFVSPLGNYWGLDKEKIMQGGYL